jgi:hypothetical protein
MMYAVKIRRDAMLYTASFITIVSDIQYLPGVGILGHTAWRLDERTFVFSE